MSFRVRNSGRVCVFSLGLMLVAATARAQESSVPSSIVPSVLRAGSDLAAGVEPALEVRSAPSSTRGVLMPLYASFASLQMLDAHSTLRAMRAGGVEQNPLLRGLADKPAALVALKAGVAVSTIAVADKVRGRSRVGAIAMMAALNSAYTVVVAHNYRTVP
jgi:uncharacterized protein DUF5658